MIHGHKTDWMPLKMLKTFETNNISVLVISFWDVKNFAPKWP